MIHWFIVIFIFIFTNIASADEKTRASIIEILADAGARASLCRDPELTLDQSVAFDLLYMANLVRSEFDDMAIALNRRADSLKESPQDVICRTALEKYGPQGEDIPNLLIYK